VEIVATGETSRFDRDSDIRIAVPAGKVDHQGACAISEAECWHAV